MKRSSGMRRRAAIAAINFRAETSPQPSRAAISA